MTGYIDAREILRFDPGRREMTRLQRRIASLQTRVTRQAAKRAVEYFLVVTPLGLFQAERLARSLAQYGIRILQRESIADWPAAATPLYMEECDERQTLKALAFEELWRRFFSTTVAERWQLVSAADYERLIEKKPLLRAEFQNLKLQVTLRGNAFFANLHPFHVPDPQRVALDAAYLDVLACGA